VTGSITSSTAAVHVLSPAARAVARLERAMARVVIEPAVPDRASLDIEIARLRGLDVGELKKERSGLQSACDELIEKGAIHHR
jgi:hypothetical protein